MSHNQRCSFFSISTKLANGVDMQMMASKRERMLPSRAEMRCFNLGALSKPLRCSFTIRGNELFGGESAQRASIWRVVITTNGFKPPLQAKLLYFGATTMPKRRHYLYYSLAYHLNLSRTLMARHCLKERASSDSGLTSNFAASHHVSRLSFWPTLFYFSLSSLSHHRCSKSE